MSTRVASRHPNQNTLVLAVLAAGLAVLLAPHPAVSQEAPAWTPLFRMSVQGGYDDNPFRLSARQRLRIIDGRAAYRDIEHVHDFVSLLRLRGEARGSGLNGQRLRLGGELGIDAYALNRRRSSATIGVFGGTVSVVTLDRDFGQLELGGRLGYRIGDRYAITVRHDRRTRSYFAALDPDQVYGGRYDVRQTFGAELRLGTAGPYHIVLGGTLQDQTTRRPARGDTGDEVDYRRTTGFVRIEFPR